MTTGCRMALGIGLIAILSLVATVWGANPPCWGVPTPCFVWGPGDPGDPYPGYCCQRDGLMNTVTQPVGVKKTAIRSPLNLQCGNLKVAKYNEELMMWECREIISHNACGRDDDSWHCVPGF
jgi:hypothetical protein